MLHLNTIKSDNQFNTPNSASWNELGYNGSSNQEIINKLGEKIKLYEETIKFSFNLSHLESKVFCNDLALLEKLVIHFKKRLQNKKTESNNKNTKSTYFIFLSNIGLEINGQKIEPTANSYQGLYNTSLDLFIVSSIAHVGIFKSTIIGSWSSLFLTKNYIPTHSSILVSPSGKAILFSGKANDGKTTMILSAFHELINYGYKILTDDWALISINEKTVICVDNIIALRQEIIKDLPRLFPSLWMNTIINKFIEIGGKKPEMLLTESFGAKAVLASAKIAGIVVLSDSILHNDLELFRPIDKEDLSLDHARIISNHTYHCPEINLKAGIKNREENYYKILQSSQLAILNNKVNFDLRVKQVEELISWIKSVCSDSQKH